MTITQLEYLLAVKNYNSFSVTANHCFVTQPTLSVLIQKLEAELGVVIFNRSRNPILATYVGEQLIRQAKIILEERDRFQIIENAKGEFTGILRVGIITTYASFLIFLLN